MAGALRTATATWSGDLKSGGGQVHLDSSGAAPALPVTWASRAEEPTGRTSPEELIAAALAACYCMALSNGLAGGGNTAERLTVRATSTFEKTDAGFRMTTIDLRVRGVVPGIEAAAFAAAAETARTGCPVSNALRGNVDIRLDAALET